MFRKNYFTAFLAIALFLIGSTSALAQTAPMRGRVELKKADGTVVPVAGATVDVLRSDSEKSKFISTKTSKGGDFGFAGLPLVGKYVLSVSAPNIRPEFLLNVMTGGEDIKVTVFEGDGKRLTEEEIRGAMSNAAATSGGQGKPSGKSAAELKKEQEEFEKKTAEITAKNAKTLKTGEIVDRASQEGKKAYDAKDYDLAIAKYDEGYKADPDFVGSAPVLLTNKAQALRARAVDLYNQSNKTTDVAVRSQNMSKVTKDLADAADAYNQSWTVLKNAPAADIGDQKNYQANKMVTLRGAKGLARELAGTERVDPSKIGAVKLLIQEYIAVETDKAAKTEAQVWMADVYRVTGDSDNAIVEYRKALEMSPDNPDALAGLGLSLFSVGETNGNTQQKQEGLNLMQRFAEVAPDAHKLKKSVADVVEYLKTQKLTPQKSGKKRN